jgi:hypothetical protein
MFELLGQSVESIHIQQAFINLNTLTRPQLDEDDLDQHYDWILVRRKGVELGFADKAYFEGLVKPLWRDKGLILSQITFYNDTREGVSPYQGTLPYGLTLFDTREIVRIKLAEFESTRCSYLTDRWNIGKHRLIISYKSNNTGIDSVHVKLPIYPLSDKHREQPKIAAQDWMQLFGLDWKQVKFIKAISPLDVAEELEGEEDQREVDFLDECGLMLYFEEHGKLKTPHPKDTQQTGNSLVFAAVKFFRARDLEARQYTGELPFGLSFDESPQSVLRKIPHKPAKQNDGPTTGRVLWHFEQFSLQILYSTIENHIFRVMLMAPGYWHDMSEIND